MTPTEDEPSDDELSISELIRRRLPDLPRAERQVGRALLLHSPTIGLESSLRLAETVGTSGATVIRFVNRLGFATYSDFQQAWRANLDARLVSPTESYQELEPEADAMRRVSHAIEATLAMIQNTVNELPSGEVESTVQLLCEGRRLLLFGGWFSQMVAAHFASLLGSARRDVAVLPRDPGQRSLMLLEAGRQDVAVAFDFRRYEDDTLVAAQYLVERKAKIILITDQWISPIAGVASSVLITRTDHPSPLQSVSVATVLVEALTLAVIDRLGSDVGDRIKRLGDVSARLLPYWRT